MMIVSWKLRRQFSERLTRRCAGDGRAAVAVVLDRRATTRARTGRRRRVARDMVIEATFSLAGPRRDRAINGSRTTASSPKPVASFCGRPTGRGAAPRPQRCWVGWEVDARLRRLAYGLSDGRYRVRDACATALGHVATEPRCRRSWSRSNCGGCPAGSCRVRCCTWTPDADPALIDCLRHHDEATVRELVAKVLGMRRSIMAVPALMPALEDRSAAVRREALLAIAEIAANSHEAVDVAPERLIRLSVDDDLRSCVPRRRPASARSSATAAAAC